MAWAPRAPRRDLSALVPRQARRVDGPETPVLQSDSVLRPTDALVPAHELDCAGARRRRRVDIRLYCPAARADRLLGRCVRYVMCRPVCLGAVH